MDPRSQSLRFLLVDDYSDLAQATAEFLEAVGLEVHIARSGEEAVKAAATFHPDIVLCDLNLPDISGLEVSRQIGAELERQNMLIAVYSAMSSQDIRVFERESREYGVHLALPKPLTERSVTMLLDAYAALRHSSRS